MKLELEIDDKGEFVGTLPTEFSAVLDKIKSTAHGEGFGKGAQKAAEEAKAQIASAVAAEKAKLEAQWPIERQKWGEIDELNKHLKTQLEATASESRKTLMAREEAHASELTKRVDAMNKRDARIRELVTAQLRALAAQAGARDESLSELEVILAHRIGYTDDMTPHVKAEDGSEAKTTAGNPVPIEAFVKQYLDNHPHHRKAASGRSGDVRRGASTIPSGAPTLDAAKAAYEGGDRSASAINNIFEATRRKSA